jgi:hypothetical protein
MKLLWTLALLVPAQDKSRDLLEKSPRHQEWAPL